MITFG